MAVTESEVREALKNRLAHELNALDRGDIHQDAISEIIGEVYTRLGVEGTAYGQMAKEVLYEVIGFGPLMDLMMDPTVTEIMVNGPKAVFAEQNGQKMLTNVTFMDARHLRYIVRRLLHLTPGKRLDELSPMADLSMPDGSRVNIVIPPAAVGGPQITIRKWMRNLTSLGALVENGTMSAKIATFLSAAVLARQTVLISGAAGSGKTTLAEILGHSIPADDRLVVIEDTFELKFDQPNQVRLLTREPNIEGSGGITTRDLFRNTLRMRPDRIILGEVRGEEAFDFLQAATSGHRGSIGIIHASNPVEACVRLENLAAQTGVPVPRNVIRQQVAHGIDLVVQIEQGPDGLRRVTDITEVRNIVDGTLELAPIFLFHYDGIEEGRVLGHHGATGEVPHMLRKLRMAGAHIDETLFARPKEG
ncbi:MAG: CpaF family protein [Alphaproteobacteria bacterium]|nr:CpaF family protein [Alphaproteobacteria bacterium]